MNTAINIVIVCSPQGMDSVYDTIRVWCHTIGSQLAENTVIRSVNLSSAIAAVSKAPDTSILVVIGGKTTDILQQASDIRLDDLEIILCQNHANSLAGTQDFPAASLINTASIINVQDLRLALRKALIRKSLKQAILIRLLESKADFRQYFRLRYTVWKQMGYLPLEQDCPESQMELNFTDRTALPVGAFTPDGNLVGCARLVLPLGQEVHHMSSIIELINEQHSFVLANNFKYPEMVIHPFDILENFKGFREYYAHLVQQRKSKAEISRVIVSPDQRNHGLGEALVDSLIAIASQNGISVLFLACHHQLENFYQRCGFRALQGLRCERFTGVNAPAIAMVCELSGMER